MSAPLLAPLIVLALSTASPATVHSAHRATGPAAGALRPQPALPVQTELEPPARAGERSVSWSELDAVVLDRHAGGPLGQEALEHVVQVAVVRDAAAERGLSIEPLEVDRRWNELDRQVRASGVVDGLAGQLRANALDPRIFRELLGVAILQEKLVRTDLELAPDAAVGPDQQELWIQSELESRGVETFAPPWTDGIVARSGTATVSPSDIAVALRNKLAPSEVREICYQILLVQAARERLPDITQEAWDREVELDLERRKEESGKDPRYQGVAYEELLRAQGVTLDTMRRDPALRAGALAWIWVDRLGEAGLREVYETRRDHFEGTYGEALRGRILFLSAGQHKNELVTRTFEEAEETLRRATADATTEMGFAELVRTHAEDPQHRELAGESGWITRLSPTVPENLRLALFADVAAGLPQAGKLAGPFRTPAGALMFWIAEVRPTPGWTVMRTHVHREERKRFLDESLPREELVTFLD